jgi:biopolymer transport protein ExbD
MSDPSISDGSSPTYAGWPKTNAPEAKKRKSARGRRKHIHTPPLSITSLTDAVTLLLVYLLKTFATNPIEVKDSSIELPRSVCRPDPGSGARERETGTSPRDGCGEVQETVIVMITGPDRKATVQGQPVILENTPRIAVNSEPVVELDRASYRVPDAAKDPASNGWVIAPLRDALRRAKELKEISSLRDDKKFDGKVIILADKQTPYRVLSEVLVTCGESGFADFRFAVIKPD